MRGPGCKHGVSQCFLGCPNGIRGGMEHKPGDAELLCPCEQHRVPAPSAAGSPATSGHGKGVFQSRCNAPCPGTAGKKGGREQLAPVYAACRVDCLACNVLPECFWGWCCRLVWLPESLAFLTQSKFYLKSCWTASAKSSKSLDSVVLLIRVPVRNLQVENQTKLRCLTI